MYKMCVCMKEKGKRKKKNVSAQFRLTMNDRPNQLSIVETWTILTLNYFPIVICSEFTIQWMIREKTENSSEQIIWKCFGNFLELDKMSNKSLNRSLLCTRSSTHNKHIYIDWKRVIAVLLLFFTMRCIYTIIIMLYSLIN